MRVRFWLSGPRRTALWRIALSRSYSTRVTFGRTLTTIPQTDWRAEAARTVDLLGLMEKFSSRAISATRSRN
jgi:hypothetical protein